MRKAVNSVKNKEMGLLKASKIYNVPRSTLKDYVKKDSSDLENVINVPLGRKPVLAPDIEGQLVNYCLIMEKSFYGLTMKDLKRMAFQLAIRNNIKHTFSIDKKTAGRKWLRLFLKRHPQLSIRKPQALSMSRIRGFTPENVSAFFSLLKPELVKIKFSAARLYNVDETGITAVQHNSQKIISLKGKQQVHKLSSAERGSLVTVVIAVSAAGAYVPPMLVFPRKRMKAELLNGAPPGTIATCHPSGWIQTDLFTQWLQHFISFTKPSKEDPVVLILDGHYSHTRNIDVIDLAREHGVSIVCLPPHSTDHMQPLDVAFMKPFKTFYSQEIENWLSNHPGRIVTAFQISEILGIAYIRAATMKNAMSGFKATGILPYNPNVFEEADFLQSANESLKVMESTTFSEEIVVTESREQISVSPSDIVPVPELNAPSTSDGRRGSALVVTSTPHKEKIMQSLLKKNETLTKRKLVFGKDKAAKITKKKKKRSQSPSITSSEDEEPEYVSTDDEDSTDNDDTECPICLGMFSMDRHGEQWIQCTNCFVWSHEKCDKRNKKLLKYICLNCSEL